MLGLRRSAGLLTKEERLVFLTVSLCLLGGGLFRACLSLFDLPDVLDPRAELASPFDGETGAGLPGDESRSVASAGGDGENAAGLYETAAATGAIPVERGAPGTKAAGGGGRLELNAATQAELEELPGIGPALAARILEHRSRVGGFKSVEDLLDVSGIGEKTLSRFRPYVYVSPSGT
jgi:competence protein ComEA